MPTFDIETEEITAFEIGDRYIFRTYFDENQLSKQLDTYYNENKYGFEIPDSGLREVRQVLEKYYYALEVVDSVEDYCVVVDRKSKSASTVRNSIMREHRGQHETLVIKDELSKEKSSEKDAVNFQKSEVAKEELEWKSR